MLSFGPFGVGGFVRLALDPGRVPVGRSVAPLAVAAFALADERFGTGHRPAGAGPGGPLTEKGTRPQAGGASIGTCRAR
ncbi:MAG TPA: hypothetical protein VFO47_03165 [Actinomycetes bacterium]|nr:hypothetical protein [Actinomycetes bacterium]